MIVRSLWKISYNSCLRVLCKPKASSICFSSTISDSNAGSLSDLATFVKKEELAINQLLSQFSGKYLNVKQFINQVISSTTSEVVTESALYNFSASYCIRKPAIDIKYILQHPDEVEKNMELRGVTGVSLKDIIEVYYIMKKIASEISKYKLQKENASNITGKYFASNIVQILQALYRELEKIYYVNALALPNKTCPSATKEERMVIETVGDKPRFEHDVYDHIFIGKRIRSLRQSNMSRIAGHRNSFFFGGIAELEYALISYTINKLKKHGFIMLSVPNMLKDAVFEGVGLVNQKVDTMIYQIKNASEKNFFLAGTAEVGLCAYFSSHAVNMVDLPLKVCSVSTCYRRETGTRLDRMGIFRVHQFMKVEMFAVTANETGLESSALHEEFVDIQKELFSELGLHFEVVNMPASDLGLPAFKKIDIEAWFPGRNRFDEISSASNCTDYQARRLNILYKNNNKYKHAHTVNATACAVPRMIIALLENGQQSNYEISLPECLWPYMNGKKKLRKEYTKFLEYVGVNQSKRRQSKIYDNLVD